MTDFSSLSLTRMDQHLLLAVSSSVGRELCTFCLPQSYHLELLSKHSDVSVPAAFPLDKPVVRLGSLEYCEIHARCQGTDRALHRIIASLHVYIYAGQSNATDFTYTSHVCSDFFTGEVHHLSMISKIHCVISVPVSAAEEFRVTVVDNNSLWGTYVVSQRGGRKVSCKLTQGTVLQPGDLLCLGAVKNGPAELDVTDAGRSCVVYRVRCREVEQGL